MRKIRFLFFVFYVLTSFFSYADSDKLDSLLSELKEPHQDTISIELLMKIGVEYRMRGDYSESRSYFENSIDLAEKLVALDDDQLRTKGKKNIAQALNDMGISYDLEGKSKIALEQYFKSLEIREEIGDSIGMAATFGNLGIIYAGQDKNEMAVKYFKDFLKVMKISGDKKGIATAYNNLGVMHKKIGKYEEAKTYYRKSLVIRNEMNDDWGRATCFANIGLLYSLASKQPYDSVNTMVPVQFKWRYDRILLDSADFYLSKALEIQRTLEDKNVIIYSLTGIGEIRYRKEEYFKALEKFEEAAQLAKEINSSKQQYAAYSDLAKVWNAIAEKEKSYEYSQKAYKYHEMYSTLKDSVLRENNSQIMAEMETKYETHKKEKEIELLNKEHKIDQLKINNEMKIIYFLVVACLLVVVLAIVVFNRYKIKKESHQLLTVQNEEIHQQAEEIRAQRDAMEKVNKQLHKRNIQVSDSINYAKKLQNAILTSEEKFKRLFPSSFIVHKPKDVVSGDFFWIEEKGDYIFFAAADCTGHGVPGAFMSLVCHRLLEDTVAENKSTDPSILLHEIDETLQSILEPKGENNEIRDGMDISFCSYNRTTKLLNFAGAHNSALLVRNNETILLEADAHPIGYGFAEGHNFEFNTSSVNIEKGDRIFLYSDGFSDQFGGPNYRKYYTQNFHELLLQSSAHNVDKQSQLLIGEFEKWKGEGEQLDDMLVVGVQF